MPAGVRSANSEIFAKSLFVNLGGSFAVDIQRQRFFLADGVGNPQQTLVGVIPGGNDILLPNSASCKLSPNGQPCWDLFPKKLRRREGA